jgi:hypothetical protein
MRAASVSELCIRGYSVPAINLEQTELEVSMSQAQNQSLPRDKFLIMAANLLHTRLLDVPRTQGKNAFKEMVAGRPIKLATVRMEDQSTVRFTVNLDYSEYKGKLNFGAFRSSLTLLISNLGRALNDNKEITMFSAENDENSKIFGVTAVTQDDKTPNIMVLGANTAEGRPTVMLRLMYIDNSQFVAEQSQRELTA